MQLSALTTRWRSYTDRNVYKLNGNTFRDPISSVPCIIHLLVYQLNVFQHLEGFISTYRRQSYCRNVKLWDHINRPFLDLLNCILNLKFLLEAAKLGNC